MSKLISKILFSIAVLVLVVLGFLLFKENKPAEKADLLSCQKSAEFSFASNIELLWSNEKYFVSFDTVTNSLELNSWVFSDNKFSFILRIV